MKSMEDRVTKVDELGNEKCRVDKFRTVRHKDYLLCLMSQVTHLDSKSRLCVYVSMSMSRVISIPISRGLRV